jgi:hypothetical protein
VLAVAGLAALPLGSAALLGQAGTLLDAAVAPSGRFHANLVLGAGRVPDSPAVRLLDPPDGAQREDPPLLRWDGSARADPSVPWTIDICLAPGRPLLGLFDRAAVEITGDSYQVPDALWDLFPVGQPLLWRVRLLPDRERGQSELEMPSSGFARLTRVAGG